MPVRGSGRVGRCSAGVRRWSTSWVAENWRLKTRCSAIVRKIYSPDRETPVARAGSSVSAIHSHDSRRDDIANPRNMRIEHLVRLVSLVFISRYTFSSTALLAGSWLRVHVAVKAHS